MANLRVNDFSGGETDRFRDGNPKFAQKMKNLLISENKRAVSRPGYSSLMTDPTPFGNQKVDFICTHYTHDSRKRVLSYETFVYSNGAIQVANNVDKVWRSVVRLDSLSNNCVTTKWGQGFQGNYARISGSEFVLTQNSSSNSFTNGPTLKFFKPSGSGLEWTFTSLGLPKVRTNPLLLEYNKTVGANNWIYAIVMARQDGSKLVLGDPKYTQVSSAASPVEIVTPDVSANTAEYNDFNGKNINNAFFFVNEDMTWQIYRTVSNGTIFYRLPLAFGNDVITGATFDDTTTDLALVSGEKLYTTGGVVGNGFLPTGIRIATFANNALWVFSGSTGYQSKVGIPDALPGSFNFNVGGKATIVAAKTIDIYPIVFTNTGVYRVEGLVDDLGNGTHKIRTVDATNGALSNKTTVLTGDKIFYLSDDGIYATNGYTSKKVSSHYNDTYKSIISKIGFYDDPEDAGDFSATPNALLATAAWDGTNQTITWYFIENDGDLYNNVTLTLDLKYPHEEGLAITSGTAPFDVTSATSADGNLHIATLLGNVLSTDPDNLNDVDVTDSLSPIGIAWDYISCSLSFNSTFAKWFTRIIFNLKNHSDIKFSVYSDTDESNDFRAHNAIDEQGFSRGMYVLKRWFPKGRLRGFYKTIRFKNDSAPTPTDQKLELNSYIIDYTTPGEGVTQSPPTGAP